MCTCSYQYILQSTSIYHWQYMQAHTSTYQFMPVHTCTYLYTLVCTGTYWYIPVHTYADLGSKNVQTRFEPEIFCIIFLMHSHCTARVQTPNTGYVTSKMFGSYFNCSCYCQCLCTWLLMTDRLRRSRSALATGHDVHRPDLDWHLRIAQPCTDGWLYV